jgi:hypothetical protein
MTKVPMALRPSTPFRGRARRLQPGQGDIDEAVDSRLGAKSSGGSKGMQTVGGEFVGRGVRPDVADFGGFGQQAADHGVDVLLRASDVVGLAAGVALIATMHLGLGGAALASTAWTGLIGNVLLVAVLGTLSIIVAHLLLGRFAFRRRK